MWKGGALQKEALQIVCNNEIFHIKTKVFQLFSSTPQHCIERAKYCFSLISGKVSRGPRCLRLAWRVRVGFFYNAEQAF